MLQTRRCSPHFSHLLILLMRRHLKRRPTLGTRHATQQDVRREVATRVGDKVRFHVSSIFLSQAPEPFPPDADLEGTVIDFSDSGTQASVFAVIEVVRTHTVIVPVNELQECH